MLHIWDHIHKFSPDIDRDSDYGRSWLSGMQALARAQEAGNTEAFQEAGEAFATAYGLQPGRSETLLGIAYLLVLLGDELTALHYARTAQEQQPGPEGEELVGMLDSQQRINSLLVDVEKLHQHLGVRQAGQNEENLRFHAETFAGQAEVLLRLQHDLLEVELRQGLFARIEQIHSRERCLMTLYETLTIFIDDRGEAAPESLRQRLDVLGFDLESLRRLEDLFDQLRDFQKAVRGLFRELTQQMIQLRMKKAEVLPESLHFLQRLKTEMRELGGNLANFPPDMRQQVENASGWAHLQQQSEHLNQLIDATITAVG